MAAIDDQRSARPRLRQPSSDYADGTNGWTAQSAQPISAYVHDGARAAAISGSNEAAVTESEQEAAEAAEQDRQTAQEPEAEAQGLSREELDDLTKDDLLDLAGDMDLDVSQRDRKADIIDAILTAQE